MSAFNEYNSDSTHAHYHPYHVIMFRPHQQLSFPITLFIKNMAVENEYGYLGSVRSILHATLQLLTLRVNR